MSFKYCLLAIAGAAGLAMSPGSPQAAPLGVAAPAQQAAANANPMLQDIAWVRHCYRHRGHRHCRRVWSDRTYYYDDGYSYAPGFQFFFGGGGRHHHHHGHHHHR